jgi:hypothetical protein
MWWRVALVKTAISEEGSASLIRVTKIGDLGKTFLRPQVLISATRPNISEDGILHSHQSENLKILLIFRFDGAN